MVLLPPKITQLSSNKRQRRHIHHSESLLLSQGFVCRMNNAVPSTGLEHATMSKNCKTAVKVAHSDNTLPLPLSEAKPTSG